MNRKRMLLTGGAGFICSNFIRKVIYEKHPYDLFSVDKIANSTMLNNIYQHKLHEDHIADICDEHIMDKLFEYLRPEVVVHMAAGSSVDASIKDPNTFVKSNVLGTQNLINLSLKYGIECFFYTSTDEVMGSLNTGDPSWTEDAPLNPKNPYAASKAAGELLIKAAANTHGLPFFISRSSNNFGARQTPDKLIPRTIKCLMEGKKVPIYGQGLQVRDWIHTYDKGNAILRILEKGTLGETYNISANQELTNIEVVKTICDLMGKSYDNIEFIDDPRPGHDFRYSVNSQKLRNLGWAPVYKFQDGLKNVVEWFQMNYFYLK